MSKTATKGFRTVGRLVKLGMERRRERELRREVEIEEAWSDPENLREFEEALRRFEKSCFPKWDNHETEYASKMIPRRK